MQRYFFNVRDGRDIVDTIGTELAGMREVRHHMFATATGLLQEEEAGPESGFVWEMNVRDAAGAIICTMEFSLKMGGN